MSNYMKAVSVNKAETGKVTLAGETEKRLCGEGRTFLTLLECGKDVPEAVAAGTPGPEHSGSPEGHMAILWRQRLGAMMHL